MKLFSFFKRKAVQPVPTAYGGGWIPLIRESFTGAWQRNREMRREDADAYHAVYACTTLITSDIAKLRVKLVQKDSNGVWLETTNPAYSPVLRKPNHFQNRIQFWDSWILSKLRRGNTYVLKQRDGRGVVVALYVLDPARCRPMVADDGSVFYELSQDNLSGLPAQVMVPAREIIHDRYNCLYHPLCGVPPLYACGLPAMQGLSIQSMSQWFFENNGAPGGILTAPGQINETTANRLKELWQENFGGRNRGKVAVLGDGLKYEKLPVSAVEQQLIEQLKWSAEVVCSTYHVPPYKIGVGQLPSYNNVQALNVEYYSQALQRLIEDAEVCLDEGLGLGENIGTEFDLDGLLRMDTVSQVDSMDKAVKAGLMSPNEGRAQLGRSPVAGGESPYLQQQNYSLAALAKRDAKEDPFETKTPAAPAPTPANDDEAPTDAEASKALLEIHKGFANV